MHSSPRQKREAQGPEPGPGRRLEIGREATRVDLCRFDAGGREDREALELRGSDQPYVVIPEMEPGQRYGFRVHGPWQDASGLRFDPAKLLLDPRAAAVEGEVRWEHGGAAALHAGPGGPDTAPFVPRSLVVEGGYDWAGDHLLRTPWDRTVIYEAHVKGLTQLHPQVPVSQRGTYAGLAHPAILEHLTNLGVTAIELLPVHQFVHDERLWRLGLRNYWGYNTIGFFAPHNAYAADPGPGGQVAEFKAMVHAFHQAGIEVLLDVVFNHTAEEDDDGPTLCFRGLDNPTWYRRDPSEPTGYRNWTGCGNTVDTSQPLVRHFVLDALRHWVDEYHVDGFRFDLAVSLGRDPEAFDPAAPFFTELAADPVLGRVKLIAEPWDLGPDSYQVGGFPEPWREWNGKFRDAVRDHWRHQGDPHEFRARIGGSPDLYDDPTRSINFVTCHDGFPLQDLVSYNDKHNEANGEHNHDGTDDNRSWNGGVEGPAPDDHVVEAARHARVQAFLASLLLADGVPMLLAGDELGRTQGGNNNGYCQDNPVSWIDWEGADPTRIAAVRGWLGLRRRLADRP